jgi:hypothetical protein
MKLLHLHTSQGREVIINAENIVTYCFDSETGETVLVTNYLTGDRIRVVESLADINRKFEMDEE